MTFPDMQNENKRPLHNRRGALAALRSANLFTARQGTNDFRLAPD